jgi:hypothetical protein
MENTDYLLQGMEESVREVAKFHLKQINYDGNNKVVKQCLAPSISYIVSKILDKQKCFYVIKDNFKGVKSDDVIKLVNVNDITNTLIDYCENYLPHANKYLSNLDAQAESIKLFCHNYVFGLIKKVEKN